MQTVQLKQWGNSRAVRIPKNILDDLGLQPNDTLDINIDADKRTITLTVDDGLTPYQKLMAKGNAKKERTHETVA